MQDRLRINYYISEDDMEALKREAEACNLSVHTYARRLALERHKGDTQLRNVAARMMAEMYRYSECTADRNVAEQLHRWGDQICQCLR